jgi:hypothetical protein
MLISRPKFRNLHKSLHNHQNNDFTSIIFLFAFYRLFEHCQHTTTDLIKRNMYIYIYIYIYISQMKN